jgi:hypothetical protein
VLRAGACASVSGFLDFRIALTDLDSALSGIPIHLFSVVGIHVSVNETGHRGQEFRALATGRTQIRWKTCSCLPCKLIRQKPESQMHAYAQQSRQTSWQARSTQSCCFHVLGCLEVCLASDCHCKFADLKKLGITACHVITD